MVTPRLGILTRNIGEAYIKSSPGGKRERLGKGKIEIGTETEKETDRNVDRKRQADRQN